MISYIIARNNSTELHCQNMQQTGWSVSGGDCLIWWLAPRYTNSTTRTIY